MFAGESTSFARVRGAETWRRLLGSSWKPSALDVQLSPQLRVRENTLLDGIPPIASIQYRRRRLGKRTWWS